MPPLAPLKEPCMQLATSLCTFMAAYSRESLCSVLLALEHHLDEIATTGEKLITLNEQIVKTDKQIDIFKDAISTPDHPLISMQDK